MYLDYYIRGLQNGREYRSLLDLQNHITIQQYFKAHKSQKYWTCITKEDKQQIQTAQIAKFGFPLQNFLVQIIALLVQIKSEEIKKNYHKISLFN